MSQANDATAKNENAFSHFPFNNLPYAAAFGSQTIVELQFEYGLGFGSVAVSFRFNFDILECPVVIEDFDSFFFISVSLDH